MFGRGHVHGIHMVVWRQTAVSMCTCLFSRKCRRAIPSVPLVSACVYSKWTYSWPSHDHMLPTWGISSIGILCMCTWTRAHCPQKNPTCWRHRIWSYNDTWTYSRCILTDQTGLGEDPSLACRWWTPRRIWWCHTQLWSALEFDQLPTAQSKQASISPPTHQLSVNPPQIPWSWEQGHYAVQVVLKQQKNLVNNVIDIYIE